MSEGVTVIVTWTIKPEFADAFVESLSGDPAAQGLSEHSPSKERYRSQSIRADRGVGRSQKLPGLCSVPRRDRRHGEAVGDDRQLPTDRRLGGQSARFSASLAARAVSQRSQRGELPAAADSIASPWPLRFGQRGADAFAD
jgi:hypothetical protein